DSALRDRAKPLLDSVLARVMQAAAAGGLLLLSMTVIGSPRTLALVIAVLSIGWVTVAISLRRPYLDLFRQSLGKGVFDPGFRLQDLDLSSAEAVIEALSSPEAPRAIAAMNLLADAGRSRLIPALILYHESEAVLLRALDVVPEEKRRDWIPLAERLL